MARRVFTQSKGIHIVWWLIVAILVIVCDQLTKLWSLSLLGLGQTIRVTSFFNLHLLYNEGSAFSFLASQSGWQRTFFIVVGILAGLFMVYEIHKHRSNPLFCLSLSLILGGDIGNIIDRLVYGHVVDFLDFHIGTWHWPTFNIADCGVCMGALLFVVLELRNKKS